MTRERKPTPTEHPSARYARTSAEWPCIFKTPLATERLDPAIKTLWASRRSDRPKWGDLRTTFRKQHCRNVNPWGSATCPFRPTDCAMAFYRAIEQALAARNPYAYFISVCRSTGAARADLGVELRARMRTDVTDETGVDRATHPGVPARPTDRLRAVGDDPVVRGVDRDSTARGVRRVATGPVPLGDVLGGLDLGPRPRPRPVSDEHEGEAR